MWSAIFKLPSRVQHFLLKLLVLVRRRLSLGTIYRRHESHYIICQVVLAWRSRLSELRRLPRLLTVPIQSGSLPMPLSGLHQNRLSFQRALLCPVATSLLAILAQPYVPTPRLRSTLPMLSECWWRRDVPPVVAGGSSVSMGVSISHLSVAGLLYVSTAAAAPRLSVLFSVCQHIVSSRLSSPSLARSPFPALSTPLSLGSCVDHLVALSPHFPSGFPVIDLLLYRSC